MEQLIKDVENRTLKVKNPKRTLEALKKLNSLIGMQKAKDMTSLQVRFLLRRKSDKKPILNSLISGPPGVGKSTLGRCLAELWHALGFLKRTPPPKKENKLLSSLQEITKQLKSLREYSDNKLIPDWRHLPPWNDQYSFLFHSAYNEVVTHLKEQWNSSLTKLEKVEESLEEEEITPSTTFVEVKKSDIVAKYSGQTSHRAKKFLEQHSGCALFFDEAYNLVNDERDGFGREALTEIIDDMTSKRDKVYFFAGYYEKMKETIFALQPGLERRFAWHFKVEDYTAEELAQIFLQQLEEENLELEEEIDIVRFFEKNKSSFRNFGGDTEKLAYYVALEHASSAEWEGEVSEKTLFKSLRTLKDNQVTEEKREPLPFMYM